MSIEAKRAETLRAIICELADSGRRTFRPGDVCSVLRERNQPMGAWLVRGEFHKLEAQGLITLDPATGDWHRVEDAP